MMKLIKQIFCKHEFVEINRYTNVVTTFAETREEEMIMLYCPICDANKETEKHKYIISEKAEFRKKEAKEEYLKSQKEKTK